MDKFNYSSTTNFIFRNKDYILVVIHIQCTKRGLTKFLNFINQYY